MYLGINGIDDNDLELEPIGFEYGKCSKYPITGAIREIGVFLVD